MKEVFIAFDKVAKSIGKRIEAHTPFFEALDKAFSLMDPSQRDRLILELWYFSNQLGVGNSLKTPVARRRLREWFNCLHAGEAGPWHEYATRMGDGFDFNIGGTENLSPEAEIYVCNHPPGILFGAWYPFVINYAVRQSLGDSESTPRWFLKEFSDNYLFGETPLRILKERAMQMMAKSTNCLLIQRDRSTWPQLFTEAKAHLESGGSWAISFEDHHGGELMRARPGVGLFLRFISDNGSFPIRPVACWKEGNKLNVNFGKPVDLGGFLGQLPADIQEKERSQRAINYVASHVAGLMPEKYRGVYAKMGQRLQLDKCGKIFVK